MKQTEKRISVFLAFVVAVSMLMASAVGIYSFGEDEENVLSAFISAYGWDSDKMKAFEWIGNDGEQHSRETEYESDLADDIYTTNEELAITLGLITAAPTSSGNAASIVAVAWAEWEAGEREVIDSRGRGTDNVKYNTWYYGRTVRNVDTNGDGQFGYNDSQFYPWCCAFISWCANECGLIESGTYTKTAGCARMRSYFINEKEYEYWGIMSSKPFGGTETPIPGDIIIWPGGAHIALIVKVNEESIETIEGNAGERVSHCTYTSRNAPRGAEVFRVQYPDNETTIFNYLVHTMYLSPAAAIGVIANIACESNFNEAALGDSGTSYGICQWHAGRWNALRSFCDSSGYNWEALDGQLAYLQYELENRYTGVLAQLRNVENTANGAYAAAFAWCHDFEVPQGYEFVTSNYRGNLARNSYWSKYEDAGMTHQ